MAGTVGAITCVLDRVFPQVAVDQLNALAAAEGGEAGSIVNAEASAHIARHVRRSQVSWLPQTPATEPIYQLIAQLVAHANREVFRYEVAGLYEPAQLATYRAEEEGHYGWH